MLFCLFEKQGSLVLNMTVNHGFSFSLIYEIFIMVYVSLFYFPSQAPDLQTPPSRVRVDDIF
jgi:hypothetical protein